MSISTPFWFAVGLCLVFVSTGRAQKVLPLEEESAVPGMVLVEFTHPPEAFAGKSGITSLDHVADQLGASTLAPLIPSASLAGAAKRGLPSSMTQRLASMYVLHYQAPVHPSQAAARLRLNPQVVHAEPQFERQIHGASEVHRAEPNDPLFGQMSHLVHAGLVDAWDLVRGEEGNVVIAIVDSGTEWQHPDLFGNVWWNFGEIEDNEIDDDGNGFVDDIHGWNFANGTNDPTGLPNTPSNASHGTQVAGIAAASSNNSIGIAGASWNAKFMPINIGSPNSDNTVEFPFQGILYAAMNGADVINISWGGATDSYFEREAVRFAEAMGAVVVASAGNSSRDVDEVPDYPSAYPEVLAVGAIEKAADGLTLFSNYGTIVEVFAPGQGLEATEVNNTYAIINGTSFAAPLVAGAAALMKVRFPDWTPQEIRHQLRVTSEPIDDANLPNMAGKLGHGRLNAFRALEDTSVPALRVIEQSFTDSGRDRAVNENETITLSLRVRNHLAATRNAQVTVSSMSELIEVAREDATLGAVDSGEEGEATFILVTAEEINDNTTAKLLVTYSDDAYIDREIIELSLNSTRHNTGEVEVSLTEEGNLGWEEFNGNSEGIGFRYRGANVLFEAGLMVGTSADQVSDAIRNAAGGATVQDQDFIVDPISYYGVYAGMATAEAGLVRFSDAAAANPLGLLIQQETYADDDPELRSFIIIRYTLELAPGAIPVDDVYLGLFTDWDLNSTALDVGMYDADRTLAIVQDAEEDPVVLLGTRLLTTTYPASGHVFDGPDELYSGQVGDGFTDGEKWDVLRGATSRDEVDGTDVATIISAGPFNMSPEQPIEVAFALITGDSEAAMRRNADSARGFWQSTIRGLSPSNVAAELDTPSEWRTLMEMPYPNPSGGEITVRYQLERAQAVQFQLYDVLGRLVETLHEVNMPAGEHIIRLHVGHKNSLGKSSSLYYLRMLTTHGPRPVQPIIIIR